MSSAKEILAGRLAKGEITEEEYDRLLSKLDSVQPPDKAPQKSRKSTGWYILGGIAVGVYGIDLMSKGATQAGQLIMFIALIPLLYGGYQTIKNMS